LKVLVTGGAGYIGTELVSCLAQQQTVDEVVVYDNLSRANYNLFLGEPKLSKNKIRFVQGELLDSRRLKKELSQVDLIYHLAALVTTPFADQNSHLFEQVNHWGTAELIYALEELPDIPFVYLSSCSVYGAGEGLADVNDPLDPKTFYGISKMRAEQHVARLAEKQAVYLIRCGNVYGYNASMRFDAVINKFMFEANFQNKIRVNGDGHQHRPFIAVEKVARVLQLLPSELEPGTYNLVDFNATVMEVVEVMRSIYPRLETLFVNHHLTMRELQVMPSSSLKPLLGPTNSLEEDLKSFKAAFRF
jgi:UDP-glucose 4-epimerase